MSELICVGVLGGAFGVQGESRLKSFCAVPEAIERYSPLTDEAGARSFALSITRPISSGFAVRIVGVDSKEQADDLRGMRLFTSRDRLPSLPDDEFYHADLIGLPVHDTGGARLGEVLAVQNHGAGDLLEVRPEGTSATVLIPFTQAAVPTVDLTAGRIVADPPEGLIPETDSPAS